MICSVVARFASTSKEIQSVIDEIASRPGFEFGSIVDGKSLPITIEAANPQEMEAKTEWLLSFNSVRFVDVAFVHFGETDSLDRQESITVDTRDKDHGLSK